MHAFPDAGLGVSVAADGVVYETDVLAASNASPYSYRHSRISTASPRRSRHHQTFSVWGQRPVLVLIGIRLGVNGVNPIYYEAVKVRNFLPAIFLRLLLTEVLPRTRVIEYRTYTHSRNPLVSREGDPLRHTILLGHRQTICSISTLTTRGQPYLFAHPPLHPYTMEITVVTIAEVRHPHSVIEIHITSLLWHLRPY